MLFPVFEAVGTVRNNKINDKELKAIESCAIPGPGSCGGMYTANTMASAIEALGYKFTWFIGAGCDLQRKNAGLRECR